MTTPTQTRQPQAHPDLAYWLAVQHQAAQQEIANKTAAGLALLWGALQFNRLDDTTPAWLHGVTLQVEQKFRESEQVAFDFVQGTKWAMEPLSDPLKKIDTVFPTRDFQLAMRATGPGSVKQATGRAVAAPESVSKSLLSTLPPEVPRNDLNALVDDIMAFGKLNSTGAAVKFALNGGRGEVQQLVVVDARERIKNRKAIGWARFTEDSDSGPCYFCAMLASQGAVYYDSTSFDRSNNKIRDIGAPAAPKGVGQKYVAELLAKLDAREGKTRPARQRRAFLGDGPAKVHDHCKCTLRPVYSEKNGMDERANFFLDQWKDLEKNYRKLPEEKQKDGASSLQKFRAVYRRPPKYSENPAVNLAAIRKNRELVARELGTDSPHVKWWDRQIRAIEAAS